jgi:hypothetical protein
MMQNKALSTTACPLADAEEHNQHQQQQGMLFGEGDIVYVVGIASRNCRADRIGFDAVVDKVYEGGMYVDVTTTIGRRQRFLRIDMARLRRPPDAPFGPRTAPRPQEKVCVSTAFVANARRKFGQLKRQRAVVTGLREDAKAAQQHLSQAISSVESAEQVREREALLQGLRERATSAEAKNEMLSCALHELQTELEEGVSAAAEQAKSALEGSAAAHTKASKSVAIQAGKADRAKQLLVDALTSPLRAGQSYAKHDDTGKRRVRNKAERLLLLLATQAGTKPRDITAVMEYFTGHKLTAALSGTTAASTPTAGEAKNASVINFVIQSLAKTMAGSLQNGKGSGEKSRAKQTFLEIVGPIPVGLNRAFERVFKISRSSTRSYHRQRKQQISGSAADLGSSTSRWTRIYKSRYKNKRSDAPCIADHWHNETTEAPGKYATQYVAGKQRAYVTHVVHHKYETVDKMYERFLKSDEYGTHLKLHPDKTIGRTLYLKGRPFYIKPAPNTEECICPTHTEISSVMHVFKARAKRAHTRFNKIHPNSPCNGSCKDSDFVRLLQSNRNLKDVLLCPPVSCPDLTLGDSTTTPAFYKRECVNGDCEKCGWDSTTNLRRTMPEMPQCLAFFDDYVMGWEQYQTVPVINEFDESKRTSEAGDSRASEGSDASGDSDLDDDGDFTWDAGGSRALAETNMADASCKAAAAANRASAAAEMAFRKVQSFVPIPKKAAKKSKKKKDKCAKNKSEQKQKPKETKTKLEMLPMEGEQWKFYDTFISISEKYIEHSHECRWNEHQRRLKRLHFGADEIVIETDYSNDYEMKKYYNETCKMNSRCTLMPVFVYHSPREEEIEIVVEEEVPASQAGGITGLLHKVKRTVTKRVHETDVWFLVSKDNGKDFATHRQFLKDTVLPHYKNAASASMPLKKVCIITDNCASQYRNKDNYAFVADMKYELGIECTHFFPAPHHNKGPWDGICGVVKRLLESFTKECESKAGKEDLSKEKKLYSHHRVYEHIRDHFSKKTATIQEAPGDIQVNRYFTRFYDDADNRDCMDADTTTVDRTYNEGEKEIRPMEGSSKFQQFSGRWADCPGHLKVREQPCCCPDACSKGEYWHCKYTAFAGEFFDYYVQPVDTEGSEAVRRQTIVDQAQDAFVEALEEGDVVACVAADQDVVFRVVQTKGSAPKQKSSTTTKKRGRTKSPTRDSSRRSSRSSRSSIGGGGGIDTTADAMASSTRGMSGSSQPEKVVFVRQLQEQLPNAGHYLIANRTTQEFDASILPRKLELNTDYTCTNNEYCILDDAKRRLWHSFAFAQWAAGRSKRPHWMDRLAPSASTGCSIKDPRALITEPPTDGAVDASTAVKAGGKKMPKTREQGSKKKKKKAKQGGTKGALKRTDQGDVAPTSPPVKRTKQNLRHEAPPTKRKAGLSETRKSKRRSPNPCNPSDVKIHIVDFYGHSKIDRLEQWAKSKGYTVVRSGGNGLQNGPTCGYLAAYVAALLQKSGT